MSLELSLGVLLSSEHYATKLQVSQDTQPSCGSGVVWEEALACLGGVLKMSLKAQVECGVYS